MDRTKLVIAMTAVTVTAPAVFTLAYKLGKKQAREDMKVVIAETFAQWNLDHPETETTN